MPAARKPAAKEPRAATAQEPATRKPTASAPEARAPAAREAATRKPTARAPEARAPAAREAAAPKPAAKTPAPAHEARELRLAGLPGLLIRPPAARALYVFAHGAGSNMRHRFLTAVAEALAARNVATLRWEFPYMAAGKRVPDRPPVAEAAVREVWHAARAELGELAMFAGGHSFGGRMTSRAHAAAALPDLRGVIFLGFPLHPPEQPGVERAEHLAAAGGPLLFLQGDRDDFAGLRRLRPVVKKLGARATLHVVKHADHSFDVLARSGRTPTDALAELADTATAWIAANVRSGRS